MCWHLQSRAAIGLQGQDDTLKGDTWLDTLGKPMELSWLIRSADGPWIDWLCAWHFQWESHPLRRALQVLVEGRARRHPDDLTGKTCTMKRVIVANQPTAPSLASTCNGRPLPEAGPHSWQGAFDAQHAAPWGLHWGTSASSPPSGVNLQASGRIHLQAGDYAAVFVERAGAATLYAQPLARTTLAEFTGWFGSTIPSMRWPSSHASHGMALGLRAGLLPHNSGAMTESSQLEGSRTAEAS